MKVLDLSQLTENFPGFERPKTLAEIAQDVEAEKRALNPYMVAATHIINHLHSNFVFPFLQPKAVNSLEESVNRQFLQVNTIPEKFIPVYKAERFGMEIPWGQNLVESNYLPPRFVTDDQLIQQPGVVEYRVHDKDSFKKFLFKLFSDMSFLRPMFKSEIEKQRQTDTQPLKEGDIVLIPDQKYGKLGIVAETAYTEYIARLRTPQNLHTRQIGVNTTDLEKLGRMTFDDEEFNYRIEQIENWITDFSSARLNVGTSAVYRGATMNEQPAGVVTINGYDQNCAVVLPHTFDPNDQTPWANISQLAIPTNNVVRLGSLEDESHFGMYSRFFPNDIVIQEEIGGIIAEKLNNDHVKGIMTYTSFSRYQRLLNDLRNCDSVPDEQVGSQFISILTKAGFDGIEMLAEISGVSVTKLAKELLQKDIEYREIFYEREKEYSAFVPQINEALSKHTSFKTLDEFIQRIAPEINVYEIPRNGSRTLAFVTQIGVYTTNHERGFEDKNPLLEILATQEANPKDKKKIVDRLRQENYHFILHRDFASIDTIPGPGFSHTEGNGERDEYVIAGVYYIIPEKEQPIRYGRDKNFKLTSPGARPVSSDFTIANISVKSQFDFFDRIIRKAIDSVDFEGKEEFQTTYSHIVRDIEIKASEEDSETGKAMERIERLHHGITQLTKNPETRDAIVDSTIGHDPVLLEAFVDYGELQKTIAIRDLYWRDNMPQKVRYLRQFGHSGRLRSHFADAFYEALVEVDMFHRGFPRREPSMLTRERNSGYRTYRSSVATSNSSIALEVASRIEDQAIRLIQQGSERRNKLLTYMGK